jgi:two-component system LytT family response regulator
MSGRIRALIVDDEEPARERLRRLLDEGPDVEVVGEAEDGECALERVAALSPSVVFLDIQMPGCSGLEVAASLPSPRPHIVFCTAFDQYAVDAFEQTRATRAASPGARARPVG